MGLMMFMYNNKGKYIPHNQYIAQVIYLLLFGVFYVLFYFTEKFYKK
jgi:hypothetical protein